ncbi:MAG: RloB family protein [Clostridioides sp.]|jgi:hypothetical protein|nr:RloB family protein [Clostridioides sp.]
MSRNRSSKKKRKLQNKILIVCGGTTEENYFENFKKGLADVSIVVENNPKSPRRIVESAIKSMQNTHYIHVWCVFDKDDFVDFDGAIKQANKNGINVAFSNQAFELWFLCHYMYIDGKMNRNAYYSQLSRYMKVRYHKTKINHYDLLNDNIHVAINNAKIAHQKHMLSDDKDPSKWESCTTVYQLVEQLLEWRN